MTIRTSCSACGVKLKVEDHLAGRAVRCPGCQQPIEIPTAAADDEIVDPFAEDAEAMLSPPSPPSSPPPRVPRPATDRKPASAKRKSVPAADQTPATPPSPVESVSPDESVLEADPESAVEEEQPLGEFPDLSEDDLRGEVISPLRRRRKSPEKRASEKAPAATTSSSLRPSKSSAASHDSITGWRWQLHWVLLVALLPLVLSSRYGSQASFDEILNQTYLNHPELDPASIKAAETLREAAIQMPDHRFEGAWLPADTYWHWGWALASCGAFGGLLLGMWPEGKSRGRIISAAMLASGTMGLFLLTGFKLLAYGPGHTRIGSPRRLISAIFVTVLFWFLWHSYRGAMDGSSGLIPSFFGYTLGVGLCKELCKAVPVVIYLKTDPRHQTLHTACLIGMASGVGFGAAEAFCYSIDYFNGLADVWVYLVRFVTCVCVQAVWTGGVAVLMSSNRDYLTFTWTGVLGFVAFYLSPAMILHGLYNTLLIHRYDIAAAVCALASFVWLQWLLRRHASEA